MRKRTPDYDQILTDVSAYIPDGIVNFTNAEHIRVLQDALIELGFDHAFINEYSTNIYDVAVRIQEKFPFFGKSKPLHKPDTNTQGETGASQEARKKGLEHIAFRYYGKNGEVMFKSSEDKSRLEPIKPEEKDQIQAKVDTNSEKQKTSGPSKEQPPQSGEKPVERQTIRTPDGVKDKTLKPIDSVRQPVFRMPVTSDAQFAKENAPFAIKQPPPLSTEDLKDAIDPLFGDRYFDFIQRTLNTTATAKAKAIEHYGFPKGGAGTIQSKAGEVMTMILTSLPDDKAEEFVRKVYDQAVRVKATGKKSVLTPTWVEAGWNNRNAILTHLNSAYPGGKLQMAAWDIPEEVEALGLSDYAKNKGKSTDVYFKVLTADGKSVLVESSLKKDGKIIFLNAGSGDFKRWNPKLSPELDHKVYSANQAKRLQAAAKKYGNALSKLAKKPSKKDTKQVQEFRKVIADKGFKSFEEALQKLNTRADLSSKKVMRYGLQALASLGVKSAKKNLENHVAFEEKFRRDFVNSINTDKNMRAGVMKVVAQEMPIRDVVAGGEMMAISNMSFDKKTANRIFGTDDFNKIKEKLIVMDRPGKDPYIVYAAGHTPPGKIPIANVRVRETGVGYTGSFKLAFELVPSFEKTIYKAHTEVYGPPKESPFSKKKKRVN